MRAGEFKLPPLFTLADLLLLLLAGGSSFAFYGFRHWRGAADNQSARQAVIRSGDQVAARLDLNTDTTLVVEGKLGGITVQVYGGALHFEKAPCALKICEKTGSISRGGEIIVCAPSRIMARIESGGPAPAGGLEALSR